MQLNYNDQFWRRTTDQMCSSTSSTEGEEDIADSYRWMLMGALNFPDGAWIKIYKNLRRGATPDRSQASVSAQMKIKTHNKLPNLIVILNILG